MFPLSKYLTSYPKNSQKVALKRHKIVFLLSCKVGFYTNLRKRIHGRLSLSFEMWSSNEEEKVFIKTTAAFCRILKSLVVKREHKMLKMMLVFTNLQTKSAFLNTCCYLISDHYPECQPLTAQQGTSIKVVVKPWPQIP